MKKQYFVVKYVMAENTEEAIRKSKKTPIHEVYVHNAWMEKNTENNFFEATKNTIGFKKIKK